MRPHPIYRHTLSAVFFIFVCSTANAQFFLSTLGDVEFSGTLDQEMSMSIEGGGVQKLQTTFNPRMDLDLSNNVRLTAIGRVRADAEADLGFDGSNTHTDVELREFYFDADWNGAYWRLGKQQVVWGQADGLRVLDVINPSEFREFILPKFEDSRIPLWIANAQIPISVNWTAQLLLIPDQSYDELAQANSVFTMSSPLVVPQAPPGVPVSIQQTRRPKRALKDADAGVRLSAFLNGWDVSLNYLYHYQDQPVFFRAISDSGITVSPSYERTHLVGGSFSNVFGDVTVRSEAGYSSDRYFSSTNLADTDGVFATGEFSYVLGIDYQGWRDWFVSGQVFQSILLEPDSGMARDKIETSATLLLRRNFMNESLIAEALLIQNLNEADGVLQASLEFEWSTNIRLMLGTDIFFGSSRGLFGQFKENDRINLGLEFGF